VTYFLTGATGFLGGELARQLAAGGHQVRALVRDPGRASGLVRLGVGLHRGDVTDPASMRAPMTGVDGVFHVAGWYKIGVRDPRTAVAVNVDGTRHVLELMRELGISRGVYTSTLAVNSDTRGRIVDESYRFSGTHLSVYDRTKAEAHRIAERFIAEGLPLVIVQPGLVYGPGDTSGVRTMLLDYLKGRLPMIPTGAAYSWAHVEDVARGHVLAMERGRPGRNYYLAGPVHTIVEAIDIASALTGLPKPRRLSPGVLKAASAVMRVAERAIAVPSGLTAESLRVLAGVTYLGNSARARTELGWRARPLADGLAETLRHEQALLSRQAAGSGIRSDREVE
jgi:nucleoside-diphosphate-sugar epimerase